ncbi:TorF family putative porin [Erythrobacter sp. 3-20A1M]|uniref:TorF family putative porin n=1 Tax=Erythrobacter sp. 3-20A1M TaxID=2653850 RepID=UPI00203F9F3D|nr:TorF family putative porin [Erythrobacter sp. 3-20A1M]
MLTSKRGFAATSLIAILAMSATPAFAGEGRAPDSQNDDGATETPAPVIDLTLASDGGDATKRDAQSVDLSRSSAIAGESGLTVSGNVALVTDYRFRGVSLSAGEPAVQGGIDVVHSSGFYVGAWASSIEDSAVYGTMELDLYGGWSGTISDGITLDAGLLYYTYPADSKGAAAGDYFEPYASIGTTLGPVGATVGIAYAWDQDSLGDDDNIYVYTDLQTAVPGTPLTLTGHVGYTDGPLAPPFLAGTADKTGWDWSVGASMTVLGGLTAGISYTDVGGPSIDDFTNDAFIGTLSYSF